MNANGPFFNFWSRAHLEIILPFFGLSYNWAFYRFDTSASSKILGTPANEISLSLANLSGLVMGKIVKEDIFMVIKPNDQVFLGHKLESCQFAANIRERIARRAMVCVDPDQPVIVFDYDHRWLHCNALKLPQIS